MGEPINLADEYMKLVSIENQRFVAEYNLKAMQEAMGITAANGVQTGE